MLFRSRDHGNPAWKRHSIYVQHLCDVAHQRDDHWLHWLTMPSKSASQHRLMEAVAHNPAVAKKTGIPQSVGKEFAKADEGKKFKQGGLYANIHAKRERIAEGSGEKMRRSGAKGAPTAEAFRESAKTVKMKKGGVSLAVGRGEKDRKSTRLNSSHIPLSRMPSSA